MYAILVGVFINVYIGMGVLMYAHVCIWMRVVAITNPFSEIQTCCGRFRLVPVMDLIHWRFED